MRTLLVPFDGSESAMRALQYAMTMVDEGFATELEVLHVGDPMPIGTHGVMTHEEIQHREAEEARRVLHPARKVLEEAKLTYQVRSRVGSAANEIARHAKDCKCDGIVMGTRGMGPFVSAMMGSVATRVVNLADVPVTLVK